MGLWRVLSDLEEDGYRTEWGLFSAEETGAPHQRIRCFILAYRNCEGSQGMLQDFGSQGRETEGRSTARCGEHCGEEVADSNDNGHCAESRRDGEEEAVPREHRPEVCGGMPERTSGQPTELAHTASREPRQSQARNGGQDTSGGSEDTRWPARPGEEQYEWEEPRVVADTKHKRSVQSEHSARCGKELSKDGESARRSTKTQSNDEAQSELGGAVDGLTHRVDRLRLLGNGVVPQTAEIAWRTLWQRL